MTLKRPFVATQINDACAEESVRPRTNLAKFSDQKSKQATAKFKLGH